MNSSKSRVTIQCVNCRTQFSTDVTMIVDARNAEDKTRLITGRLNTAQCPRCNTLNTVAAPMLYHDGSKEMLIVFVPMEVNLKKDDQERIIGDLVRDLTNSLPQNERKGYLFNPKRALTLQNLVDQVLEADGVTPEMMAEQKARVDFIQAILQTPPEQLEDYIKANDAKIDARLLQTMTVMAQRIADAGQAQAAEHVLALQGALVQLSSYGQELVRRQEMQEETVREVAARINDFGAQPTRGDFVQLALEYADDEDRLQALVGLIRPAMDQVFMNELTMAIAQAPADQRDRLDSLKERIVEMTAVIDQQAQMQLQQTVAFLQAVVNSPNPEQLLRENSDMIDDTFLAVLQANIEESERRQDAMTGGRLKQIYQMVMSMLQEGMRPELRFINELLEEEDDMRATLMIKEQAPQFGDALLDVIDAVSQVMAQRGDKETLERLAFLRAAAERSLQA